MLDLRINVCLETPAGQPLLHGLIQGDALLSVPDPLASDAPAIAHSSGSTESIAMPADPVDDMPR
ncbi:hypothetical protein ACNQFN_06270 [Thauera butanivorans]|uniref:hypothetical protein n=1 Tax=Thauera butanivorans TaxID=86174 RepID=UPI003AB23ECF